MKFKAIVFSLILSTALLAQGFKVDRSGTQTFNLEDKNGRNQIKFESYTPLEDIIGTTSGIQGTVTFDIKNFAETLKGELTVPTASLKTGIALRDEHLSGENWLAADKHPTITFKIKSVENVEQVADNKLKAVVIGDFTMKGVTKEVRAETDVTYLVESEKTKTRAAGDLLGIRSTFDVKLSEFGVQNDVVGNKVAENINVTVAVVGNNG